MGEYCFVARVFGVDGARSISKVAFCATLLLGMLAHLYCWVNSLYSHDSLLVIQNDIEHLVGIGRFMQVPYLYLRGNVAAPWLIGTLGLVYLAVANVLMVAILRLQSRWSIVAFCGVLTTNATVTLINATYIKDFDIDMLALLLAVLAAFLLIERRSPKVMLPAAILLVLSMGLYSSYIEVFAALLLLRCVRLLLEGSRRAPVWLVLWGMGALGVGACVYYGASRLIQSVSGVGDYAAYNSLSAAFSYDGSVFQLLTETWLRPIKYFVSPETHLVTLCAALNVLIATIALIALVDLCRRAQPRSAYAGVSFMLIAILPFAMNFVNLITGGMTHALMILSYYMWYGLAFMLIDMSAQARLSGGDPFGRRGKTTIFRGMRRCILASAACLLIVGSNTVYSNQVYLKKDLEYQSSFSLMSRLAERIESHEGYEPGKTQVVLLGSLAANPTYRGVRGSLPPDPGHPMMRNGVYTDFATGLDAEFSATSTPQMQRYFTNILGCPIRIAGSSALGDEVEAVRDSLAVFPSQSCIGWHGDVLVVRLS